MSDEGKMGCKHCKNGFLDNRFGCDVECVNGVLIDIDEYHEGWQRDLCYPVAPCHPDFSKQASDEDWCSDYRDVQRRLRERSEANSDQESPHVG